MSRRARLIAVDGTHGRAVVEMARRVAPDGDSAKRVSRWDASGLFEQLVMAGDDMSAASPRLLLLLYAADLAFRLRWEIDPALAEGQTVVAAPYVDTAMAFGKACGVPVKWLNNLFMFARRPAQRHIAHAADVASRSDAGFLEFACEHLTAHDGRTLAARTRKHLKPARKSDGGGRRRLR